MFLKVWLYPCELLELTATLEKIPQQNLFKKNIGKTPEHAKNPDMEQSDIVNMKSCWNHTEEW